MATALFIKKIRLQRSARVGKNTFKVLRLPLFLFKKIRLQRSAQVGKNSCRVLFTVFRKCISERAGELTGSDRV